MAGSSIGSVTRAALAARRGDCYPLSSGSARSTTASANSRSCSNRQKEKTSVKVLITGGGGFIGSNLADRLLDEGHEVLTLDNYETGRRGNLTERDGLTIVEDTIVDSDAVTRVFSEFKPDKVVHAAASYKDPEAWAHDVDTNGRGTANVVRATQQVGADR